MSGAHDEAEALGRAKSWDDVRVILERAEDARFEEDFAIHERAVSPNGMSLRDMLKVLAGDNAAAAEAEDAKEALTQALTTRALGYLESGELKPEEVRRYVLSAARGLLPPQTAVRAFDKASLLKVHPNFGESLERAADTGRHRRRLEEMLRARGSLRGLKLGVGPVDALINGGLGAAPGEVLHIVGAEGSLKTALLLNALCGYAAGGGRALFLSLDMPPWRIEERLLGRLMDEGPERVRELVRQDGPEYRRARAAREADGGRLQVMGGRMGLGAVRAALAASEADVVAVDYVTAVDGFRSELDAARAVTRMFRELADRWGLTVVLLSQMSRQSRQDQAQGGTGGHAMGGSSLEQFVDFELELYLERRGLDGAEGSGRGKIASFIPDQDSRLIATLRKNRSGPADRSFELFPRYPSLVFEPDARPVERVERTRRVLFRPSGVV